MDVLLIPCWRRGEFLQHCLRNLVNTGDLHTVHVVFKPDSGHNQEVIQVIEAWTPHIPSWEIASCIPSRNKDTKQSLNLLSGYQYAAGLSDGLVFMVEEDIMVAKDFFRFHRALHAKEPDLFCSLSPKNHNRRSNENNASSNYYLSHGDFCSWGTCFRKEVIEQLIAPHVNEMYLAHPQAYCATNWPTSTINRGHTEQDGLIRRIQEGQSKPTAYPHVPRAFHAGFYGYNREQKTTGSLKSRIDLLSRTIYDPEAMRRACLKGLADDSVPVSLDIDPFTELHHVPA